MTASILFISCGSDDVSALIEEEEVALPIATADEFATITNESIVLNDLLLNDTTNEYASIISFDEESVEGGEVSISRNILTYTPSEDYEGTDSFTYTICDAEDSLNCSTATVNIQVNAAVLELFDDSVIVSNAEDSLLVDLLSNDFLVGGASAIESINTELSTGEIVLNMDGTISYTPVANFNGEDTFEYTVCDTNEIPTCDTATVTITVADNIDFNVTSDISAYYEQAFFFADGQLLFDNLSNLVETTHVVELVYTPGVWETLQLADLDPDNSSNILLIYGHNDEDSDGNNDRSRGSDKIDSGGTGTTEFWNREHVYSRSLGTPNLDFVGPGSDAHHLRPADPATNSTRSNRKFEAGSGIAAITANGNWYPGDEWTGDIARMMMYMYLRYEDQCLPTGVGVGNTLAADSNMIDLFLEWNIEDPVSDFELQRNNVIEGAQGNRNPFIDNPYLATLIWGGEAAENTWE